jgi:hypothetical protein
MIAGVCCPAPFAYNESDATNEDPATADAGNRRAVTIPRKGAPWLPTATSCSDSSPFRTA